MVTALSEQAQVVLGHRYFLKDDEGETTEDSNALCKELLKQLLK